MRSTISFLVLDDDADIRFLHRLELEKEFAGCEVTECASAAEALTCCAENSYDAILTDYSMPDGSGASVIAHLRERGVESPILMVTGTSDPRVHERAYAAGATRVIFGTKLRFAPILRSLLAPGPRALACVSDGASSTFGASGTTSAISLRRISPGAEPSSAPTNRGTRRSGP